MRKRGLGVTIVGVLFVLSGLLGLTGVGLASFAVKELQGMSVDERDQFLARHQYDWGQFGEELRSGIQPYLVSLALVNSLITLAAGIGLLMLQHWAWWLTLLWSACLMLMKVIHVTVGKVTTPWSWLDFYLGLGLSVFTIWYLLRPAVKAQFISKTTNR